MKQPTHKQNRIATIQEKIPEEYHSKEAFPRHQKKEDEDQALFLRLHNDYIVLECLLLQFWTAH